MKNFLDYGCGINFEENLLSEKRDIEHGEDICGVDLEEIENIDNFPIRTGLRKRDIIKIPSLSELETLRHFVRLSQQNYSIDSGFYPLGSCTMKYNPRINEKVAAYAGFAHIHPYQDEQTVQGALEVMDELQTYLAELSGLKGVSLLPAAGAHGELAGMMVIRKAHEEAGNARKYVLVPDAAHGTNPATAVICGYETLTIDSNENGCCNTEQIEEYIKKYGTDIAGIMLTNPNTCGKFEPNINKIADMIHSIGAYFYCDGANFNAIVGKIRPADFGVDVMHFNLHKTFSTPHGGGGPGCGPIAVNEKLSKYLPNPTVIKSGDKYKLNYTDSAIGKIKGFYGQFGMMVRALSYMKSLGKNGLKRVAEDAVLSSNYILARLKNDYHVPFGGYAMHECLLTDKIQKKEGVSTMDIAKTLIEHGCHPMTIYFPLIVSGAMLIEPTETESKQELDRFIDIMLWIAREVREGRGEKLLQNPKSTPRRRVDEVKAAKDLIVKWEY